MKRTGKCSLCGDCEARGFERNFFLYLLFTGPWEEENGREREVESLSEKKAIRDRRERF